MRTRVMYVVYYLVEKMKETRSLKIKCCDLTSRFATQPVTVEEVAEAKKQNQKASNEIQNTIRKEILRSKY